MLASAPCVGVGIGVDSPASASASHSPTSAFYLSQGHGKAQRWRAQRVGVWKQERLLATFPLSSLHFLHGYDTSCCVLGKRGWWGATIMTKGHSFSLSLSSLQRLECLWPFLCSLSTWCSWVGQEDASLLPASELESDLHSAPRFGLISFGRTSLAPTSLRANLFSGLIPRWPLPCRPPDLLPRQSRQPWEVPSSL